jgi:sugar lactone lactonase YvrE
MKTKVKKYKLAFAVFGICSLTFNICQAQMISTVAGMGMMMYGGDGGPATAAMLSGPTGNAMDGMGNLYIVDNQNNLIRMVNTAGIINTVVGTVFSGAGVAGYSGDGGQATAAELNGPVGMAFDASRNMYIADYANNVVRKVTTAGIITTVAGMGGMMAGYAGDGGQATMAMLSGPTGVAIDAMGNLYIADSGNRRIRKVNASGIITTVVGNGTQGYSGDGGQATAAELNFSYAIAIDTHNNLYIADAGINVIRMVNTMGVISTIAGNGNGGYSGDGGAATSAEINNPSGITVDAMGNVYIGDAGNNVIRKVTAAGMIITMAGNGMRGYTGDGGQAMTAELFYPMGLCLDASDNLLIVDNTNNVIRKVTNAMAAGIQQVSINNEQLSVYPNPASGILHVEGLSVNGNSEINICDVLGNVVIQHATNTEHYALDLSSLQSGVYFVTVTCNGANTTKKIVVEK